MNSTAVLESPIRLAGAAGDAVAPLLRSAPRPGRVAAVTRHAVLITVAGAPLASGDPGLVCIADGEAVRLPCSVVVVGPLPAVEPTAPVMVGDARIALPGYVVRVGRWWRVPRPTLADPAAAAARAAQLPTAESLRTTGLPRRTVDALRVALATGITSATDAGPHRALNRVVADLVGLGPGLTPAGDDLLAGALVALTAAHHPSAGRLRAAVADAAPARRTTAVSAALLAHAARGESAPALADLLTALDAEVGPTGPGRRSDPRGHTRYDTATVQRLLAVGHTSGAALLAGAVCGLATVLGAPAPQSPRAIRPPNRPPSTHAPPTHSPRKAVT